MNESRIKDKFKQNVQLSEITYLRVGGPAKYFLIAEDWEDISSAVDFCSKRKIPYYMLGRGSNVLFTDEGFSGVIISTENMNRYRMLEKKLQAEAGVPLPLLVEKVASEGLSGMEELIGIPGTVGGAVIMNAGAYGRSIGDCISGVYILKDGEKILDENPRFSYRTSTLSGKIVLKANIELEVGNREEIERKMWKIRERRKKSMPEITEEIGTCGSVFKNPDNAYAGKLIEEVGLKGERVGGAFVSEKHGNYIFTEKCAKAEDVIQLIRSVRDRIFQEFDILLETEVKIIGREKEIQI